VSSSLSPLPAFTGVTDRVVTTRPNLLTCSAEDYAAYLDSMLAHLRRVHRGQVLRYYGIDA
jgi:hypothetical protein